MLNEVVFLIESVYLVFMFFFFKTKIDYSLGGLFDIQKFGAFFVHNTGQYENKICPFGKVMAGLTVVFWLVRLFLMKGPEYRSLLLKTTVIFDIVCVGLAVLMNYNAFIYIVPLMFLELYFIKELLKN